MDFIFQILVVSFLGIIAACSVTYPIIYLVQKNHQHKELIQTLKEIRGKKWYIILFKWPVLSIYKTERILDILR